MYNFKYIKDEEKYIGHFLDKSASTVQQQQQQQQ